MKKYNVKVNGISYDVEVEEIGSAPSSAPAAPAAETVKTEAPSAPAAPKQETGGNAVKAPMPGTILKLNVNVGDKIEKDSLVCILEAMKMENEIFAPVGGTVTAINAPKGATVNTGDPIVTLG